MGPALFSTAYFPPVEYFAAIARSEGCVLEAHETFQKQTWRNRCRILTAGGVMDLPIPVKRGGPLGHKTPILETEIDYSENWVHLHLRALEAAYKNSPFYDYYIDELTAILKSGEESLFQLNTNLLRKALEFCGLRATISLSDSYRKEPPEDFRSRISPKSKEPSLLRLWGMEKPYYQVFTNVSPLEQGFVPNLSILDLLFNEGPNAISYLT